MLGLTSYFFAKLREGNVFTGVCYSLQIVRLAQAGGAYPTGMFFCYRLPTKLQEGSVFTRVCSQVRGSRYHLPTYPIPPTYLPTQNGSKWAVCILPEYILVTEYASPGGLRGGGGN